MDSLAYAKVHSPQWRRLNQLASQRRLSGAESDELIQLYQRIAGELAQVRTKAPDPDIVLQLSATLSRARSRITAMPITPWAAIGQFFAVTLPLAFYRIRRWIWVVTALCLAVWAGVYAIYAFNPSLLDTLGSYSAQQQYAKQAFAAYYSDYSHSDFSAMVWSNNAWLALQCVAGGITGFLPVQVLYSNMATLGQSMAIMGRFDELGLFFQLILPHGQLELMAIFMAGAAGLRLFWAWVSPGALPRVQSLGREGRHTMLVGVGLVFVLFISGLEEGFVTPSLLPWWLKIVIGSLALALFWAWIMYFGARAVKRGYARENPNETGWHIEYAL